MEAATSQGTPPVEHANLYFGAQTSGLAPEQVLVDAWL